MGSVPNQQQQPPQQFNNKNSSQQQQYYKGGQTATAIGSMAPGLFTQQPPIPYQFVPHYSIAQGTQQQAYLSLSSSSNSSVTGGSTVAALAPVDSDGVLIPQHNLRGPPIAFYPQQQIGTIIPSTHVVERKRLQIQPDNSASNEEYSSPELTTNPTQAEKSETTESVSKFDSSNNEEILKNEISKKEKTLSTDKTSLSPLNASNNKKTSPIKR